MPIISRLHGHFRPLIAHWIVFNFSLSSFNEPYRHCCPPRPNWLCSDVYSGEGHEGLECLYYTWPATLISTCQDSLLRCSLSQDLHDRLIWRIGSLIIQSIINFTRHSMMPLLINRLLLYTLWASINNLGVPFRNNLRFWTGYNCRDHHRGDVWVRCAGYHNMRRVHRCVQSVLTFNNQRSSTRKYIGSLALQYFNTWTRKHMNT